MEDVERIDWGTLKGIANEPTWDRFVDEHGGAKVSRLVPNPEFENADYLFAAANILLEMKELESEFTRSKRFKADAEQLIMRYYREEGMRGPLFGEPYPDELLRDFVRLLRPPLQRICKKANRQIRETKRALDFPTARGVLLCVNNKFRALDPEYILALFGEILQHSYSSVDALVYLSNHYVDIPGSNLANIVWIPIYSDRADASLPRFINDIGRKWFDFVEREQGPAKGRIAGPDLDISGATAIKPR